MSPPSFPADQLKLPGYGRATKPITTPGFAGLFAGGDLIIAADGEEVRLFDDLLGYLVLSKRPGETITLTVIRDGEELDIDVELGTRP